MEVVEKKRIIPPQPEKVIDETVYVALDGKEFSFKSDCILYEKKLKIEQHPVFKNRIMGFRTFDDEYFMTLYYIGSQDDYDFWNANIGAYHLVVNNWNDGCGPGWYLFYTVDGGDYSDSHYLYKFEKYYNDIKDDLDLWFKKVSCEINYRDLQKE